VPHVIIVQQWFNKKKFNLYVSTNNPNGGVFPLTVVSQALGEGGNKRITSATAGREHAKEFYD
jgi:hypothetical protein